MVKKIYRKATIGPSINIQLVHVLSVLPIELDIKNLTKGWNVVRDEQHYAVCEIVHLIHTCDTDEYVYIYRYGQITYGSILRGLSHHVL